MEVKRFISTAFWKDTKVIDEFTPEDRYFFLYLMTNPNTDITGCYEISIKQMARDTGYQEDVVTRLIDRMKNHHGVIDYNAENKEVLLINWHKYNWTKSPKLESAVSRRAQNIKTVSFKEYIEELIDDRDTVYIQYPYTMDTTIANTVSITNTNTISNTNKELSNSNNKNIQLYGSENNVRLKEEEFERLKDKYPQFYEKYIEDLSLYLASTGKKYKSHNATIQNWIRRDLQNGKIKQPTKQSSSYGNTY